MGTIYLTDLANKLRIAGLDVVEYNGWKNRSRSSGGYDAMPLCVMWHHTASGSSWDGQQDADYIAEGHQDSPISNLYIDRTGLVWVIAAGATNTNGKGNSIQFSRGTVPMDSMNTRALGVEMGNNGVGERWPQVQVDAMFIVSNTCNAWFGNRPDDISTHQFYAPTRKIDPATCNIEGLWAPNSCNSSGSWDRASVQQECVSRSVPEPPELPEDIIVSGSSSLWLGGGRLDNFVTGNDKKVYHNWYDTGKKGWTAWECLEGVLDGSPSVTGQGDNGVPVRIDITGKGVDNPPGLWHRWYTGGKWSGWERVADWP